MDRARKADRKLLRACSLAIIPTPGYVCTWYITLLYARVCISNAARVRVHGNKYMGALIPEHSKNKADGK